MTISFTHKLIALGILSVAVCASTRPVEAKWIINRAGDVVLVRTQVLGVESSGIPEFDDMTMDEESMRRASDEMLRELEMATQPTSFTEKHIGPAFTPTRSIKEIGPVPDKFRHIDSKDIQQIRIVPRDDISGPEYETENPAPVGGMGPKESRYPSQTTMQQKGMPVAEPARDEAMESMKRSGVSVEVQTDADKLVILQESLEMEKKGGNVMIGPSSDKSAALEMRRNQLSVKIPFPVKIDSATKEILIESSSGDLPLRIMPEQAKVILETKSKLTLEDATEPVPEVVDGKLLYTYKGQQSRKMFGFIPVSLAKTVRVSAEDGTLTEVPQVGVWNRMKNWLSR